MLDCGVTVLPVPVVPKNATNIPSLEEAVTLGAVRVADVPLERVPLMACVVSTPAKSPTITVARAEGDSVQV